MMGGAAIDADGEASHEPPPPPPPPVVMENDFLAVYVNPTTGVQAILDKVSGTNFSFRHEYLLYDSAVNNAYDFHPAGQARPLGPSPPVACAADAPRVTPPARSDPNHPARPGHPSTSATTTLPRPRPPLATSRGAQPPVRPERAPPPPPTPTPHPSPIHHPHPHIPPRPAGPDR